MMKTIRLLPLVTLTAIGAAGAQDNQRPSSLQFEGATWRILAREATPEHRFGREALKLVGGRLWRDDIAFEDGVIEFDVAFNEGTAFIGPMWRAESDARFEEIYFRTHLSGKPDAVQYTPVENGISAWQIFSDENAIAPIDLKFGEWNHFKAVIQGDKADLYFNSDKPSLHIPDLKTDISAGRAGLRSTGADGAPAWFANIRFRPLRDGEVVIGEAGSAPDLPEGLISRWRVSTPFAEADVADVLALERDADKNLDYKTLDTETNGVANLARLAGADNGADTVFVRLAITSDKDQMKELRFGYSDRVRIYLNGKRIYFGNAGWRVRDYRFLGTVGFFDSAGLDLKKGENELLVAVSETFGGWAWAGAIADRRGITIGD